MAEITETFAAYILECKANYEDLCGRIARDEVPFDRSAELIVTVSPATINEIRLDQRAVTNGGSC